MSTEDETLKAWLKGCDELIESGVATDHIAICPVALRRRLSELRNLRAEMKRINDLAIHLNSGGRDPDEKCYTKRDVEALVAISRAVEHRHG